MAQPDLYILYRAETFQRTLYRFLSPALLWIAATTITAQKIIYFFIYIIVQRVLLYPCHSSPIWLWEDYTTGRQSISTKSKHITFTILSFSVLCGMQWGCSGMICPAAAANHCVVLSMFNNGIWRHFLWNTVRRSEWNTTDVLFAASLARHVCSLGSCI